MTVEDTTTMRFIPLLAASALLFLTVDGASAAGCRRPYRLGSENYSRGINAAAPSRAIFNPCSSMYRFGRRSHRRFMRRYPGATVHH